MSQRVHELPATHRHSIAHNLSFALFKFVNGTPLYVSLFVLFAQFRVQEHERRVVYDYPFNFFCHANSRFGGSNDNSIIK